MKKYYIICACVIGYGLTTMVVCPLLVKRNTPPLAKEFREIELHTCTYYDRHGRMPENPEYLPENLRALVGGATGITWDAEERIYHYRYPRAYPLHTSWLEFATFGLVRSNANVLGTNISPDAVAYSTPIYKAEGKLPE